MASNEEILNSRLIGFIEALPNSDNARISVMGYKNTSGNYVALDVNHARQIFYPDGKVFAPSHHTDIEQYDIKSDCFIEFSARLSLKDASFGDDYIRDLTKPVVQKNFTRILTISNLTSLRGFITQDDFLTYINKSELNIISSYFF